MRQRTQKSIKLTPSFEDGPAKAIFDTYANPTRLRLLDLRALIFETARDLEQVGAIVETVKWKQPAYLPAKAGVGTTIRIGALNRPHDGYAIYFHCQTSLVATFRQLYPDHFTFESNRAIQFASSAEVPRNALKHCIGLALTYHL